MLFALIIKRLSVLFAASLFLSPTLLYAKIINLNNGQSLQQAVDSASNGDQIILDGIFKGHITINKSITLTGKNNAQIIGNQIGHVIHIKSDNVIIENLKISNSGRELSTQDSAIFIDKDYKNDIVRHNKLTNNLIGVHLWGSINSLVEYNEIVGMKTGHENDRGNGVQVWNSPGSIVSHNTISYGRDGIFTTTSKDNIFTYNHFEHLRYSIHYMYTNNSEVGFNYSTNNSIGYALMFSDKLNVHDNISIAEPQGIMTNFLNYSKIYNNTIIGSTERCLFIYNSNYNYIYDNYFKQCRIGVHYTAGAQNNHIYGNSFVNNQVQVKYIGTKNLEWSENKRGNYWQDHLNIDLNGDGIADSVYHPNSLADEILWEYPNTNILFNSPAMKILSISQSQFPALFPGGITDSYPLITPVFEARLTITDAKNLQNTNHQPNNEKNSNK